MLKNITLSADAGLIRRAREKAQRQRTTVNAEFRRWLGRYVDREQISDNYAALMQELSYAQVGRTFSRDEMNER